MKESDKRRLQVNFRELVNNILVSDIQDYLYEKDVINAENLDTLNNEKSPQKAARYLVGSILPKKGPQAFETFCRALREGGYEYLADTLENTKIEQKVPIVKPKHEDQLQNPEAEVQPSVRRRTVSQHSRTADIDEEVLDMDSRFQSSCRSKEPTHSSKQKDRQKIQQLEIENFKLKKQLSFYEDTDTPQQNRTPRHRVGSDPVMPLNQAQESTSLDSGLSDMEDIVVDVDETFDNTDGNLTGRSQSGSSTVRTVITPRFEARDFNDDSDDDDDQDLVNTLAADIVNLMYSDTETNPRLYKSEHCPSVMALRKAVKTVADKHGSLFNKISKQVDLNATWREINEQMASVYSELLAEEYQQDALTWGIIIILFCVTGFVAKRCARRNKVVLPLSDFLADYINRKLDRKIQQLGGWESLCSEVDEEIPCDFPASLLQLSLKPSNSKPSHSVSKANEKLKNKLGKTAAPSKLLQRRGGAKSGGFLRTF